MLAWSESKASRRAFSRVTALLVFAASGFGVSAVELEPWGAAAGLLTTGFLTTGLLSVAFVSLAFFSLAFMSAAFWASAGLAGAPIWPWTTGTAQKINNPN